MKLDLRGVIQDHWSSGLDLSPLNPNFYLALSSIDQYFFICLFFSVSMTTWRFYEAKKHGKMLDGVERPVSDIHSRDKIMRQSACLVFNPIAVNNFASLINCTPVGRASDSMMATT